MDGNDAGRLIYLVLLLAAIGGWVMVEYRHRLGQALRTALAWGMIFLGVMAGYGLWHDIRHDVMPRQMVSEAGVVVPRAPDGHYYLTVAVNGQDVLFMADTGATNVVLSQGDAMALGLDPQSLAFRGEAMTANGPVRTARVVLPEVAVGPFQDQRVTAWVNEGEMDISLLGMDYLGRFRIAIENGEMILSR